MKTKKPAGGERAENEASAVGAGSDRERISRDSGASEVNRGADLAAGCSPDGTAVSARMSEEEDRASLHGAALWEDTGLLEVPWLSANELGGGNLWHLRDWGIASVFGYLRETGAAGSAGTEPIPAGLDMKAPELAAGEPPLAQDASAAEPTSVVWPEGIMREPPTFSEWRTAISIMPWLQETGVESSEAEKEVYDMAGRRVEEMPGLRPHRGKRIARLERAGRLDRQPGDEEITYSVRRATRPIKQPKEGRADFPLPVIEAAWRRQGGRCAGCGRWLIWSRRNREGAVGAWESHHRVPIEHGGSSVLSNCVLLCSGVADCHFRRGHGGVAWTHYAPLEDSSLLFLFAGTPSAAPRVAGVPQRRNLLRDVLGIPQSRSRPPESAKEQGAPDSTG
ncbi:MAG: HNH endonuclease signature motif containing protein [Dehalococcoidia bacterium]|nr:HNH endonuclease signature motif containing protein [Dehalococcoidia bacterium]